MLVLLIFVCLVHTNSYNNREKIIYSNNYNTSTYLYYKMNADERLQLNHMIQETNVTGKTENIRKHN